MNGIKKILVVCRMTSHCGLVVRTAAEQARLHNAGLLVLHVIHDPFGVEGWNLPLPSLAADYHDLMVKTRKELDERVEEVKAEGIPIEEIIREGLPYEVIMEVVEKEGIDLLVLPAHGESKIEHFLFGGDNEKLIRSMPCSILLVKKEPKALEDESLHRMYHPALARWKE